MSDNLNYNSVIKPEIERKTESIHLKIKPSLKLAIENISYDNNMLLSEYLTTMIEKEVKKIKK